MARLFLSGTGRPSLSAKVRGSPTAGERVCSGVDSQATELLGACALTSLFSHPHHKSHMGYLIRLLSG